MGVYWSVSASGDELILEDAETGEVLRKPIEESEDRRAAERQAAEEAGARQKEAEARAAAEATVPLPSGVRSMVRSPRKATSTMTGRAHKRRED